MARAFSAAFYKSAAWHRARELALMRDRFLCVKCGNLAEEVHHIEPLTPLNINDPAVTLRQENLMSLCHECHTRMHGGNQTECVFDENGQMVRVI